MAKPNYSFEKRQRELAKKRKKEEKTQRKASPGQPEAGGVPEAAPDDASAALPAVPGTPGGGIGGA